MSVFLSFESRLERDLRSSSGLLLIKLAMLGLLFWLLPNRVAEAQVPDVHRCGVIQDLLLGRWGRAEAGGDGAASHILQFSDHGAMHVQFTRERATGEAVRNVENAFLYAVDDAYAPSVLTVRVPFLFQIHYRIRHLDFEGLELEVGRRTLRYERMPEAEFEGIELLGPPAFVAATGEALRLLREQTPEYLHFLKNYVRRIQRHCPSGAAIGRLIPVIHISDRLLRYSPAVYASILVHEAVHFYQYLAEPDEPACTIPRELEAIRHQVNVLRKLDPEHALIDVLNKASGTHGDRDGDGDCDWEDYGRRSY